MKFIISSLLVCLSLPVIADQQATKIALGKLIFTDSTLSVPAGQSCNSCHNAKSFYTDPGEMISPGADPSLFGNRNTPMIAYTQFNPELYWDDKEEHWVGGFFLDGRAKTIKQQALGPFTNPLEMGLSNQAHIVEKIRQTHYAHLFEQVYGRDIWATRQSALNAITDAIVAYESGPEFALFTSKYDYYLQGRVALNPLEQQGLELFEAEDKGNCAACHPSQQGENGEPPLLTDFTYDNLGLPQPQNLPFFTMNKQHNPLANRYIDRGLAENPNINNGPDETGKFKVSSLRNIAKSAPYMHNGIFDTLEEVLDFYNSRDMKDKWGPAEISQNVNDEELGDLKLTDEEVTAIITFMKTLTDGYQLPKPVITSHRANEAHGEG